MSWDWNGWTITWLIGVVVAGFFTFVVLMTAIQDYKDTTRGTKESKTIAQTLSAVIVLGPIAVVAWPVAIALGILTLVGLGIRGVCRVFREALITVE